MNTADTIAQLKDRIRQLEDEVRKHPVRLSVGGALAGSVSFGKAVADWASGNNVMVTPIVSDTDPTPTGEGNVACAIFMPGRGTITGIQIKANDVCAYIPFAADRTKGILVNVNFGSGDENEGYGSRRFQVHQMATDTVPAVGTTPAVPGSKTWDWVRAHD